MVSGKGIAPMKKVDIATESEPGYGFTTGDVGWGRCCTLVGRSHVAHTGGADSVRHVVVPQKRRHCVRKHARLQPMLRLVCLIHEGADLQSDSSAGI